VQNIKFSDIDDVDEIMQFINDHWKENHILSQNKGLFLYEYLDNQRLNFVISKDSDNKINGILGFIKSSDQIKDIWCAIWKAVKTDKNPMLGIELLEYLRNSKDFGVLTCNGIAIQTINIYKFLNIYTSYLSHYVILNDNISECKIAKVDNSFSIIKPKFLDSNNFSFREIFEAELTFDFEKYKKNIPYKDKSYFVKRYFNHPIYKYKIYGVFFKKNNSALLVTREEKVQKSKVLRIVDYIGEDSDIKFVSKYLYSIIVQNNYEYADFMCYGFDKKQLINAGFFKVDHDTNELVIPNYFNPFVQENTKIYFFADTNQIERVRMVKADGDQDRPS
jgi:hypothetical protein